MCCGKTMFWRLPKVRLHMGINVELPEYVVEWLVFLNGGLLGL